MGFNLGFKGLMGATGSLDVNTVDKLAAANELHVLRK